MKEIVVYGPVDLALNQLYIFTQIEATLRV